MKIVLLMVAGASIAAASGALAAEYEPVVVAGPFAPAPAYPAAQVAEPTVTPGPFAPPPAFAAVKVYDWTGFYVGLNVGGAFGSTDWTSVPDLTSGRSNVSGGLVGGTAGYNLQTADPFVLGVEVDLDQGSREWPHRHPVPRIAKSKIPGLPPLDCGLGMHSIQ